MSEEAMKIATESASHSKSPVPAQGAPQTGGEYRSGVFAKSRSASDGGGWGLVVVDIAAAPRVVTLTDGAVIGAASRDAKLEGPGIAPEHARVSVRSDGCYLEDLGSQEGTFVGGVRAKRINVSHGDVVRLGNQLAVFVECDFNVYEGALIWSGSLVHGLK